MTKSPSRARRVASYLLALALIVGVILIWVLTVGGWPEFLASGGKFVLASLILVALTVVFHLALLQFSSTSTPTTTPLSATTTSPPPATPPPTTTSPPPTPPSPVTTSLPPATPPPATTTSTPQESKRGMWTLIIGKDRRWSTSRFQATVWTYVIGFALVSLLFYPDAFQATFNNFQTEYLILLGSPVAAAVLAARFTTDKVDDGTVVKSSVPPDQTQTGPAQAAALIANDEGRADVFDFQYICFNLITLIYFFSRFLPNPQNGLPDLPETLVALTGVSAAGYATKKYLEVDPRPAISGVSPEYVILGQDQAFVDITGANFGEEPDPNNLQSLNKVLLNGRQLAKVETWHSNWIKLRVPDSTEIPTREEAVAKGFMPPDAPSSGVASVELKVQDRYGHVSDAKQVKVNVEPVLTAPSLSGTTPSPTTTSPPATTMPLIPAPTPP